MQGVIDNEIYTVYPQPGAIVCIGAEGVSALRLNNKLTGHLTNKGARYISERSIIPILGIAEEISAHQ